MSATDERLLGSAALDGHTATMRAKHADQCKFLAAYAAAIEWRRTYAPKNAKALTRVQA